MKGEHSPGALETTLGRWDAWLAENHGVAAMLSPKATGEQLAHTEERLGVALPSSLRALLAWHDGERSSSTLFDTLIRQDLAPYFATMSERRQVRFLSHLLIGRAGATAAELESADSGLHQRGRALERANAKLVPFLYIPEGSKPEPNELEEDGDWFIAVDTLYESVWIFESAGEELEGLVFLAPSLAAFFDGLLDLLASGKTDVEIELPAAAREIAAADPDREAAVLLALLVAKEHVAVAAHADLEDLQARVASCLAATPRARAIDLAVALFTEDDAFEEVFADDAVLREVVAAFL